MASPAGPRYRQPPSAQRRRLRVVLLAALLAAFTALVVAVALPRLTAPVSFQVLTFELVDAGTVRVGWEVARDPGVVLECQVRARGADGSEVGNELVGVPASGERRTVVSHDLTTAAPAVTGEVRSCIAAGP